MFGFFKRKKADSSVESNSNITLKQFVALLVNDQELMMPVYLEQIRQESDGDKLGLGPLVYIWNVDHVAGSFSLSVNGKCVGHLLETFVSRDDPAFTEMRDEAMNFISQLSLKSVQSTVQRTGVMPDILFAYQPPG